MDNLTHSLVGALLGQAGLKRRTGLAMPALIVGANLPDVDAACFFWLDGVEHLGFRRGITHGPPALVLLPLLLAGALWAWDRGQAARGTRPVGRPPVRFGWLFALAFVACLTHPALDWLNVYGIRLLEPFSSRWFYGDTLFIIDVWLWAILGLGAALSLWRERGHRAWTSPARWALTIGSLYVFANGLTTREAAALKFQDLTFQQVIASPLPFLFWKRDLIFYAPDGRSRIIRGYSGPREEKYRIDAYGVLPLAHCNLAALRRRDRQVDAFLVWSRAPLIERDTAGELWLRDARFLDTRVVDRFSVALAPGACAYPPG